MVQLPQFCNFHRRRLNIYFYDLHTSIDVDASWSLIQILKNNFLMALNSANALINKPILFPQLKFKFVASNQSNRPNVYIASLTKKKKRFL